MRVFPVAASLFLLATLVPAVAEETLPVDPALRAAIAAPQRSPKFVARDGARHPAEELAFFGLRPDATVVEIWPGGGYWTEILAPYLREHGTYYAALDGKGADGAAPEEIEKRNAVFKQKLAENPGVYDKVIVTRLGEGETDIAPPASADVVLTFRNLHNWMKAGNAAEAFGAFYKALKPGGILGVEEHRSRRSAPQDPKALDGYVREDFAIALAQQAGFALAGSSEIDANPKDTADWPKGVWTLPPTYALGDTDRAKYAAIGEADNFVLKFRKPAE